MALHVDIQNVHEFEKLIGEGADARTFALVMLTLGLNGITERNVAEVKFRSDVVYGMGRGRALWSFPEGNCRLPLDVIKRLVGMRTNITTVGRARWINSVADPASWLTPPQYDADASEADARTAWNRVRAQWQMPLDETGAEEAQSA